MKFLLISLTLLFFLLAGTAQASSTLIFPRLSFAPQDLTGIAIGDPGSETASVTFTAYGVTGQILSAGGSSQKADSDAGLHPQGAFTNPVSVDILAGQNVAEVTIGIFGSGIDPEAIGWVEATSEADDLTGVFQFLDTSISFLDGADLPPVASNLIFQDVRVDEGFSTTAFLVNPIDDAPASVNLSLVTSKSTRTKNLQIPAKGLVELDVAEFCNDVEPVGVGRVSDPRPPSSNVPGFQVPTSQRSSVPRFQEIRNSRVGGASVPRICSDQGGSSHRFHSTRSNQDCVPTLIWPAVRWDNPALPGAICHDSTCQKCCRRGVRSQPFVGELFIASGDDPTTQEDRPHLRTHGRAPSRVA